MLQMTGDIGTLVLDGKQVGGFRGWTAIVELTPPVHSKVIASGFWMLEKINTNKLIASFYAEGVDTLELIKKGEVVVNLPADYALDTLIIKPIEMTFKEDFDWRE